MADNAPGALVVGVGASRGVPVAEVVGLIDSALRDAGLSSGSVVVLATADARAGEPGIVRAAARLGVPLVAYSARELAAVEVPHPSDAPLAALGIPSVAEAAALVGGGELLVPKRKSAPADGRPARVTCAVATAGAVRDGSPPDGSGARVHPGGAGPAAGRHDDHRAHDHDRGHDPGRALGLEGHDDGDRRRPGLNTSAHHPASTPSPSPPAPAASEETS